MKKNFSVIFIGHIALDTIFTEYFPNYRQSLGGSVSYCSLSLSKYTKNVDIHIVSKIGQENFNHLLLEPFKKSNIDLKGIQWVSGENTKFTLSYHNHSRSLTLTSKSPDLTFDSIPDAYLEKDIDSIILVPICNEISSEFVIDLIKNFPNAYIGIDLQGFVRKIKENGSIILTYDIELQQNLENMMQIIGKKLILKGSEEEMKILSGKEDLIEVMEYFQNFSGLSIMTLGERGSYLTTHGKNILKIPAYKSKKVVDETGAGDVYLAIFIYEFLNSQRKWADVKKAALYASAAASFEIEKEGVNGFQSKKGVKERLKSNIYIN